MTQTILLGGLIEIKHGYAFKGEYFSEKPTKNVLITPGNFEIGGGFKSTKLKYYDGPIDHNYILKPNDLVVTMTDLSKEGDTLGFAARIPKNGTNVFLHNQRIGLVKTKTDQIDEGYLYWLMRSSEYHNFIVTTASGSTVKHTSPNRIYDFKVNLPPISTQQKVANILDSIDEKIELNHQINETLEQMGQTLFRHYFIDNPEAGNWEAVKIGKLVNIKGGGTPSTKNNDFWDGDILWSSPRDLTGVNDAFLLDTNKKITKKGLVKVSSGLLPKSTLLLSSRAPIGYVALAGQPLAINQGYIAFLPEAKLSNHFMYFWLKHNMDRIKGAANGSTFMEISKSAFRNITTLLPDEKILKQFDKYAMCYFEQMRNNQEEIKTLTTLRDIILPRLIDGRVKV